MSAIQSVQAGISAANQVASAKVPASSQAAQGAGAEAKTPSPANDTIQISSAARTALMHAQSSPAQEATETPAQTAKEASNGDSQAARKLAQERTTK